MSDPAENVEVVRRAYRSWLEEGVEGLLAVMHPDIEWFPPPQSPEPGPHRGTEEILRIVGSYMESFDEFEPVPDRILPAAEADQVLALATLTIRGAGSGAEVRMPVAHLLTLREDKIVRFEVILDRDEALRRAGLDPSG